MYTESPGRNPAGLRWPHSQEWTTTDRCHLRSRRDVPTPTCCSRMLAGGAGSHTNVRNSPLARLPPLISTWMLIAGKAGAVSPIVLYELYDTPVMVESGVPTWS